DYPDKDTGNPPPTAGTSGPQYEYTDGGRLRTRTWLRHGTDGNSGIVTTYTYGFSQTGIGHGDLVGVAYSNDPASTPSISYTYDRQGRRSQVVQNNITTTLTYNDANQPLSESYANGLLHGLSSSSTYNNSLQRTALSVTGISGTYSVSYGYDTAGRLQAANSGVNGAVYTYLANSPQVSQIAFTNSGTTRMTTTKQYDNLNRLTSVQTLNAQQATISSYDYQLNAANQRIRTTLSDGSYWLYSYDRLGQVISGKRFWQDGTPVAGQQYEYTFDDIGNRKSASMGGDGNGGALRQARYDNPSPPNRLNQYVQREVPAAVDIMGIANPTASVTVNNNTAYRKGEYFDYALSTPNTASLWYNTVTVHSSYGSGQDTSGQLFVPKSPEQFAYDPDGNLTNDGHWAYIWDAENRLISMTNNASTGPQQGLAFEYDWSGRRIHKQVWSQAAAATNNVKFLYDGWNLLAEVNATNNAVIRSFVWGSDLSGSPQGAGGVGGLLAVSYTGAQTTNCFVAFDGNGNVAALADAGSTSILAQYEYGPFGEVLRKTGTMASANPFRFSTKYHDDETDLLYYGYRYYKAVTGRWTSRDPIGEHSFLQSVLSRWGDDFSSSERIRRRSLMPEYLFVSSDGVNFIDLLGLLIVDT
ncbi:MAG: RHS repeat-associated core domain-containing protein, partial [Verrucomicrobia bacterium]|nr:RHS repeat-associated core domain-containing protein [Verrucomicrobiota bacterium]